MSLPSHTYDFFVVRTFEVYSSNLKIYNTIINCSHCAVVVRTYSSCLTEVYIL
jgi:hypothetical protein